MSKQSEMKNNITDMCSFKRKCMTNDYDDNFEIKRAKLEEQSNNINSNIKPIEIYSKPQKRITYKYIFRLTYN